MNQTFVPYSYSCRSLLCTNRRSTNPLERWQSPSQGAISSFWYFIHVFKYLWYFKTRLGSWCPWPHKELGNVSGWPSPSWNINRNGAPHHRLRSNQLNVHFQTKDPRVFVCKTLEFKSCVSQPTTQFIEWLSAPRVYILSCGFWT